MPTLVGVTVGKVNISMADKTDPCSLLQTVIQPFCTPDLESLGITGVINGFKLY